MTLTQFLTKLEQTPRRWHLVDLSGYACIRIELLGNQAHCPLSRVADTEPCALSDAAKALGLNMRTARRIGRAADNYGVEPQLRRRLLKACGLS